MSDFMCMTQGRIWASETGAIHKLWHHVTLDLGFPGYVPTCVQYGVPAIASKLLLAQMGPN